MTCLADGLLLLLLEIFLSFPWWETVFPHVKWWKSNPSQCSEKMCCVTELSVLGNDVEVETCPQCPLSVLSPSGLDCLLLSLFPVRLE